MATSTRATLAAAAAVATLLLAACSDDDRPAEPTESETAVTAPPSPTPEEKAKAEIVNTFANLIQDMDYYYSNASDVTDKEIVEGAPTNEWPIIEQADLEIDNWISDWSQADLEIVGNTTVVWHEVTDIRLEKHTAKSVACRDLRDITFVNYDGEPITPSAFVPSKFQTWDMTWYHWPDGRGGRAWSLTGFKLTLDEPC